MNNPFDYIEEFLAGELSETDAQTFEQAMLENSSLREEVEMVKEMELFAQRKADNKDAIDVVKVVMEEGKRIEEGKRKGNSLIKSVIAVVMLSLLTLASYVYFSQETKEINHEELFAEYFEVPEMAIITKGESQDSILQIAQALFNNKEYNKSLVEFEKLNITDEIELYRAINNQMLNEPETSIEILNTIQNKSNDIYWFTALAYLQIGDTENARVWLVKIDNKSVHYKKSQSLIKEL